MVLEFVTYMDQHFSEIVICNAVGLFLMGTSAEDTVENDDVHRHSSKSCVAKLLSRVMTIFDGYDQQIE